MFDLILMPSICVPPYQASFPQQCFSEKREDLNIKLVDFDSVTFLISTPEGNRDQINVSIQWGCFKELIQYGAKDLLGEIYSGYVLDPPVSGYDYSLKFDLNSLPGDKSMVKPFPF